MEQSCPIVSYLVVLSQKNLLSLLMIFSLQFLLILLQDGGAPMRSLKIIFSIENGRTMSLQMDFLELTQTDFLLGILFLRKMLTMHLE